MSFSAVSAFQVSYYLHVMIIIDINLFFVFKDLFNHSIVIIIMSINYKFKIQYFQLYYILLSISKSVLLIIYISLLTMKSKRRKRMIRRRRRFIIFDIETNISTNFEPLKLIPEIQYYAWRWRSSIISWKYY